MDLLEPLFRTGSAPLREPEGSRASLLITGDCAPRDAAKPLIRAGRAGAIVAAVRPFFEHADWRAVQFEAPLVPPDFETRALGDRFMHCAPDTGLAFLRALNANVVLLANNHVGDFGPEGVLETIRRLDEAGLAHAGAGPDAAHAARPLRLERGGLALSLINVAENEFGMADQDYPGAHGLDYFALQRQIRAEAGSARAVIVVQHGGNEYNPIPSPMMVEACRSYIEAGAAAVVNIHTHCPQSLELWQGKPIVYCPGNFYFPLREQGEYRPESSWFVGFLVRLDLDARGVYGLTVIPTEFVQEPCIRPIEGERRVKFLAYLGRLSAILHDPDRFRRHYRAWCIRRYRKLGRVFHECLNPWPKTFEIDAQIDRIWPLQNTASQESSWEVFRTYFRMLRRHELETAARRHPELETLIPIPL